MPEAPAHTGGRRRRFLGKIPNECFFERLILRQGLGSELGQIYHFHAVVLQDLSKNGHALSERLSDRDVVKKQSLQRARYQMLQFGRAGATSTRRRGQFRCRLELA